MPEDNTYFLRSKTKENQSVVSSCLSKSLFTQHGMVGLKDLIVECDQTNYWIPAIWPVRKEQRDHCCGLYAMDIGLHHGFGRSNILTPPARKDKKDNIISLRQIAKQKELSAFGEIFSIKSFKKLADHFKFPNCKILKPNTHDPEKFTHAICNQLKKDSVIVTSLDMKGLFPGAAKGLHTHWALIFGYVYIKNKCYFLATQWGLYFLFPADKVFWSNKKLPEKNPKAHPHFIYYKNEDTKNTHFRRKRPNDDLSTLDVRYAIGDSLDEFRFSLFCIPVLDAPPCIDLKRLAESNIYKV